MKTCTQSSIVLLKICIGINEEEGRLLLVTAKEKGETTPGSDRKLACIYI